MDPKHSAFQEDLAAYAIGALDPEEAAALEEHLQTCETCRSELAGYRRVGTGLLSALPPQAPRAAVRRNLEKRLGGERQAQRARPQFSWSIGQMVFAGLLAVLIALNVLLVSQVYSLRQEQAELLSQRSSEETVIAMLAYPSTRTLAFEDNGVTGSLLVDQQRNLVAVFAWNLPSPAAGKTYQVWLIDTNGNRTSGGFLVPEADYPFVMSTIWTRQPLTDFTGIGVTLEPAGGSPQPTGPRMFRAGF